MDVSKFIKLSIRSLIWNLDDRGQREGSAEISDEVHRASMRTVGEKTVLSYSQDTEGGKVNSEIIISDAGITVKKSGAVEAIMIFKPGGSFEGIYSVPPFSFDMKLSVKAMRSSISDNGGEANILYNMDIGGAKKSCSMKITLCEDSL